MLSSDELKQRCMTHVTDKSTYSHRSLALLVILLSGDIQTNPGPNQAIDAYPCAWCDVACDWSQSAICCDNCSYWFHRSCISMSTEEYIRRGGSDETWVCPRCKTHNVDSFSYRGYNLSVSNRYEALTSISDDVFSPAHPHSVASFSSTFDFNPEFASSPLSIASRPSTNRVNTTPNSPDKLNSDNSPNIRLLVMNVNSAKGKPAEIANILDYTKPDVVVMSETKLDKSCYTSEFLPKNYTAFRRDITINCGGVLIATKKGLVADEVYFKELGKDCELMCVRVSTCSKMPSLYVCAYYRPQTDNTPNTSLDSLKSALDQIEQLAGRSKSTLVVTGDFNCPNIDWDSMILI